MNITEKRRLQAYLVKHNDGTEEAKSLIEMMENECHWADSHLGTVEVDDLVMLDDETAETARRKLGKGKDDKWTVDDCQAIAEEIYQNEDEYGFSDWLHYAIEYMEPVKGDDTDAG